MSITQSQNHCDSIILSAQRPCKAGCAIAGIVRNSKSKHTRHLQFWHAAHQRGDNESCTGSTPMSSLTTIVRGRRVLGQPWFSLDPEPTLRHDSAAPRAASSSMPSSRLPLQLRACKMQCQWKSVTAKRSHSEPRGASTGASTERAPHCKRARQNWCLTKSAGRKLSRARAAMRQNCCPLFFCILALIGQEDCQPARKRKVPIKLASVAAGCLFISLYSLACNPLANERACVSPCFLELHFLHKQRGTTPM